MLNLERNICYEARHDDSEPPKKMDEQWRDNVAILLRKAQLLYLLETRWLKPLPSSVTHGHVGRRTVDVLQTLVDGERVNFYLDRETHLPLKVAYVSSRGRRSTREGKMATALSRFASPPMLKKTGDFVAGA